jgi:protein-disulfide isomerase
VHVTTDAFRTGRAHFHVALLAVATLAIGACKPKGEPPSDEAPTELPKLTEEPPAADKKPVEGAKLDELKDDQKPRFEVLVDLLPSPCGKAHSLRTSRNTDASCLRARFAVDYVTTLLADGASDSEIKELYVARYPRERVVKTFKFGPEVPRSGRDDARVVVTEFYDYGCPSCGKFAPELAEAQAAFPDDVTVHYKMFPLAAHPDSPGAAAAALAAHRQGKFKLMHELLFGDQLNQKKPRLDEYATQIGLDMAKYEADFKEATTQIEADKAEGNTAGVKGTPTVYINGVLWEGPPGARYLKMWLEEELALNR